MQKDRINEMTKPADERCEMTVKINRATMGIQKRTTWRCKATPIRFKYTGRYKTTKMDID